ncbi:MAG: complex I subunit 5 family protein [Sulfolobales archaeon]|nr:complex I subunit 5 family protein [Sulfolobales archaeon]MCX8186125.1 complex I subunit 5 family protein [Sulfolobales archaeon]MDW7969420.1 complex I subunit 5 family protein [Sulfolobales archaeon]
MVVLELVVIPMVAAVVVFSVRNDRVASILSTATVGFLSIYLVLISLFKELPMVENYIEVVVHGHFEYSFSLGVDGFNIVVLITALTLLPSIYLYSYDYMKHRIKDLEGVTLNLFYGLLLLNTSGIVGVLISYNMIAFIIFYELIVLTSWGLIYFYGYGNRVMVSFTYLVWSLIASLIIVIGLSTIYVYAGTFQFNPSSLAGIPPWVYYILLIGFAIKMGLFGVHMWLPLAHAEAPTPFSAVLSPLIVGIGGYGFLRVVGPFVDLYELTLVLLVWGIASIIYGGLGALLEDDIKRILAYSSISHMGYLVLALSVHDPLLSTMSFSYHYLSHAYAKALLFLSSGVLIYALDIRNINMVGGILRKYKLCGLGFMVGFLSLAGLPPFAGFISKLLIISSVIRTASEASLELYALSLAALVSMVFTIAYGLRVIKNVVFGALRPSNVEFVSLPITMHISLIIIIILLVITWFIPHLLLNLMLGAFKL